MSLGKVSNLTNSVAFKGYDKRLDEKGNPVHSFYYPHSDKYKLQMELLLRQKNGGEIIKNKTYDIDGKNLELRFNNNIDKKTDMYYRFKLIDQDTPTAAPIYVSDNGLLADLGKINGSTEPFNRILPERKILSKPGIMQLQVPDLYYPGVEYNGTEYTINEAVRAKALSSVRTHVGKMGGTLNGMTYMLPEKAKEGYTRIVGTPFTKDEVSSHLYWTQNAYQMSSSIGSMKDMRRFQQALFKNGINFINDAALVNEGLQGIHFSNLLKWGEDSPFYTWFKTFDLDSSIISLGVIPENSQHVRMKIVNSPIRVKSNPVDSPKYDPTRPTYVQLYDDRLVSDEQLTSDKIFTKYDKTVDNHYEISSYDDAIIPYAFEVDPKELVSNIKKYNADKEGAFADADTIKNVLTFKKFRVDERRDGGVELWDGNVDIAKLNFSFGNYDSANINKSSGEDNETKIKKYKQGVREVQDYAVLSGKYWSKLSADMQLEYAATAFPEVKTVADVLNLINEKKGKSLPISVGNENIVNRNIIENVIDDKYNLFKLNNIETYTRISADDSKSDEKISDYEDIVRKSIMNVPMEALEVADDTTAILSTGYLMKRASTDAQIGLTRFDIYKSGYPNLNEKYAKLYKKTDSLLLKDVYKFVDNVLTAYNKFAGTEKIKDENGNVTDFGKYVINAVVPDLTKYALIKALDKNAEIKVDNDGTLDFEKINKSKLSLKSLGLVDITPEKEAENIIKKFDEGLDSLNSNQAEINKMAAALHTRLVGLNELSFKVADMLIDRTESGMGLRVDAAKDIAAIDSVRATTDDISKAWNDVINFWSIYVKEGVHKENPHAYTTAEVTDIDKFVNEFEVGDLNSEPEAARKMLINAGVTSIANYSYFFAMPTNIYSKNAETGYEDNFKCINEVKSKLDCISNPYWRDNSGLLFEGTPDSSIHSYTFSGNHDKPRILQVLGLDMGIYNGNFDDVNAQKAVLDVFNINDELNLENLSIEDAIPQTVSGPAVAMGKRLKDVFRAMVELSDAEKAKLSEKEIVENDELNENARVLTADDFKKLSLAIAKLAKGVYQVGESGETTFFNADSFGQKPFDVVIKDVIKTADLGLSESRLEKIENIALEKMLKPAMEKYKSIYKMLTLLPGDPTDFAGDKEAMTGFESKSKNVTQQNRNAIRWEWVQKDSGMFKDFVANYKRDLNAITALRSRPELSALNNGHTISLINWVTAEDYFNPHSRKYSANLRYNDEGSQVITIFGKPDLSAPNPNESLGNKAVEIPYINLASENKREGLQGGLNVGTVFKNADPTDNSFYRVEFADVDIPVEVSSDFTDDDVVYKNYEENKSYTHDKKKRFVIKRYTIDSQTNREVEIPISISKKDDNAIVLYKS